MPVAKSFKDRIANIKSRQEVRDKQFNEILEDLSHFKRDVSLRAAVSTRLLVFGIKRTYSNEIINFMYHYFNKFKIEVIICLFSVAQNSKVTSQLPTARAYYSSSDHQTHNFTKFLQECGRKLADPGIKWIANRASS